MREKRDKGLKSEKSIRWGKREELKGVNRRDQVFSHSFNTSRVRVKQPSRERNGGSFHPLLAKKSTHGRGAKGAEGRLLNFLDQVFSKREKIKGNAMGEPEGGKRRRRRGSYVRTMLKPRKGAETSA